MISSVKVFVGGCTGCTPPAVTVTVSLPVSSGSTTMGEEGFDVEDSADESPAMRDVGYDHRCSHLPDIPIDPIDTIW